MKYPEFPKEFLKHCHRKECAFIEAGSGMKCENCGLFLTRPFLSNKLDREFLPLIEKYYKDVELYETIKENEKHQMSFGEGI